MVFGDSLSAAYGIDVKHGWVHLLQNKFHGVHTVINSSISGDTSAGGLARLPSALGTHQPDIVLLELGANDGLRGLSLSSMKANLAQIIDLVELSGAQLLVLGIKLPPNYGPIFNNRFNKVYADLAEEKGVSLVPFFLEGVGGVYELMQDDGLHPNELGQPILLENIFPYLQKIFDIAD